MGSEWRKSSYSGGNSSNCVECRTDADGVLVRDTTNREGFRLSVSARAWSKFTSAIK
jgi:hypothetical protein